MRDKKHLLLPHFHRDTAATRMKDIELNRIVEEREMFKTKVDVLTNHYDMARKEKASLSKLASLQSSTSSSSTRGKSCWRKTLSGYWVPRRREA